MYFTPCDHNSPFHDHTSNITYHVITFVRFVRAFTDSWKAWHCMLDLAENPIYHCGPGVRTQLVFPNYSSRSRFFFERRLMSIPGLTPA